MSGSSVTIIPFLQKVLDVILNPLITLLFALAFLYFAYGIIRFLSASGDDKSGKRIEARNSILWGIVGMVIMFSVYGIINFVLGTFGIGPNDVETKIGRAHV